MAVEDIRISIDFLTHRKRRKLERILGPKGVLSLIDLWLSVARQRPSGVLYGYDEMDVELEANWTGEDGALVKALVEVGFLDECDGTYSLHGWEDRQEWVTGSQDRSDKSRMSRLAKVNQEAFRFLKNNGVEGLSKEDFKKYKDFKQSHNESLTKNNESLTTVERPLNDRKRGAVAPAPAPTPSPVPTPRVKEKDICPEPQADSVPPVTIQQAQSAVITIPLKGKKAGEYPICQSDIDDWSESYPAVDVLQALRSIRQWNLSNPAKQKTIRGIRGHITTWLDKEQNRGGNRASPCVTNGQQIKPRTYAQAQDMEERQIARMLLQKQEAHNGGNGNGAGAAFQAGPRVLSEA